MTEPTEQSEPGGSAVNGVDRAAVVDLLGALAYGELTAVSRLAADAELAPGQPAKAALARVAVAEFLHYEALVARLSEMGTDPEQAMAPFIAPIDGFHDRTKPGSWLESLVKAYVGDGIATDFYREISAYVDPSTQELVRSVLQDVGQADFAVRTVREAIDADPRIAGRLALWGRRLVGEALSQAQRVAVERDALASLLVGGTNRPGADLAEIGRMFARLTDEHTRRMGRLGLAA
ncbi:MAG: ferritin-like fold-containing protein [Oryzihumus sp.]